MVNAPLEFQLVINKRRRTLLRFLGQLRKTVVLKRQPVTIDFTRTEKMWAEGTLLFRAELCRIRRITEGKVRMRCIAPRNHKVSQVLKQVGIYSLLGYKAKIKPVAEDVVNWRTANGSGADGKKYDEILGSYDGVISDALAQGLYLGLTEAMTNCHHHAYLWQRPDGLLAKDDEKDWWMFSQERDEKLTVVFCDLGVGIPATLPKTKPALWKKMLNMLANPDDGSVIREAIESSRSRTGKSYRGKGLRQLVDAIDKMKDGNLFVFSNKGCYIYKSAGATEVRSFADSILGTLILWTVPLNHRVSSDD